AATEALWFDLRDRLGATEFLGYDADEAEAKVLAILVDGKEVNEAKDGQRIAVITNQTPFYGESGGQMGDAGVITVAGKGRVVVDDTQRKLGTLFVHYGTVEGSL